MFIATLEGKLYRTMSSVGFVFVCSVLLSMNNNNNKIIIKIIIFFALGTQSPDLVLVLCPAIVL